ncbi:MAG: prepilin-type N-terminal cleavage/methylation domain-containing protein [Gammaproteobacteria bacterium]|nr:prepilin-type N-terminal cleavage/methylation domain-containing protein [Gammaproteobacteria bacterium]
MSTPRCKSSGFTLIELVVVLFLVGILAAVAMPRFFTVSPFQEWGFNDELSSAIRYANKVAIATGCDTGVVTTATTYDLYQRATSCTSGSFTRAVQISGGDVSGYHGTAPSGITLVASVASFYFDSNGRPRDTSGNLLSSAVTISVGSTSITVEPETGYTR